MCGKSSKNDIIVFLNRDPLYGYSREEYIEKLKTALSGRVEQAWFFGSFTNADFSKFSDIDIILVSDTGLPFIERAQAFSDLLNMVPTTDILVYTPEEFKKLKQNPSPGFWQSVVKTMERFM